MAPASSSQALSVFSASPLAAAFARSQLHQQHRQPHDQVPREPEQQQGDGAEEEVRIEDDDDANARNDSARKRKLQHVCTQQSRIRVVKWMIDDEASNGKKGLFARTIRMFPNEFRSSTNANSMKASRWWGDRQEILQVDDDRNNMVSVNHVHPGKQKKMLTKAAPGRGPKRATWVEWLYGELLSEFDRLRKAGVKFSPGLLIQLSKGILEESDHPEFTKHYSVNGKPIVDSLTTRWIQHFMAAKNIVPRAQCGKLKISDEHQERINKLVSYHLGVIARGFESGELDENLIENWDETHFVINMDNGKTLGFRGDTEVKYADVVSGGIGMTMVVRLTGGPDARICPPMLIFQNENCFYPIRNVPDDVPGVVYRTAKKGFMTSAVWLEYLREPRVQRRYGIARDSNRPRVIFVDNVGSHQISQEATRQLNSMNATIRFLVANATDKIQPCDSFVIAKIKMRWIEQWEAYKMNAINDGDWQRVSGALKNPGKTFFLKLAADSVKYVDSCRDANGLKYARKAMIRCGLSKDVTGEWRIQQLSPELQAIVAKHRNHFEGEVVP
ncbi:unnamed protein product (mitochondrion) [Plasmodiophora brassicae]|uniref:DDE-1 domain-containing protein n=1 Tax=Plasmodiophora brassicae TaxID=37360 RepID=A0A3P3Y9Y3_PLABS|nr:unnamed protein product [Plasmodiophora brassicae]